MGTIFIAMKVSHTTHYITPPTELLGRLSALAAVAAFSNALGHKDLYNQAKDAYHKLSSQWDDHAQAQAKAQSHTTWLGGGDTYLAHRSNEWEWDYKVWNEIAKSCNNNELQNSLRKYLDIRNK